MSSQAQVLRGQNNLVINESTSMTIFQEDKREFDGSPFLIDDELKLAFVSDESGNSQKIFLRYNVLNGRMEFSTNSNVQNLLQLPESEDLTITVDNRTFKYMRNNPADISNGYYEIIQAYSKNVFLVAKHAKVLPEITSFDKGPYATQRKKKIRSSRELFYIDQNGDGFEVSNNKRRLIKSFPKLDQDRISDYIKVNKVKFKDDLIGLKKVIRYYSST